jgi:succinyl-CoA synthetase alpha subunit
VSVTRFKVFPNLYKDSVTLMQVGAQLRERAGIRQASCLMATPANLAQLSAAELEVDAQASPSDLLLVVSGEPQACDEAIEAAAATLQSSGSDTSGHDGAAFSMPRTSLALAFAGEPDANLALISVPGDYAAAEAMKALKLGLHVMLFSDNVSVAQERAVKAVARERDLLVMGPDCGTAIVNGIALGFANVVRRGDIGLVAASGTGLQEVTCRIHHLGGGVSQALGTGGRDLQEEIGGITMLQGLAALAADPQTRVIVLISKPPAPEIARRIEQQAAGAGKPVVIHFLGAAPRTRPSGPVAALSLRHAAAVAVALARGEPAPASDNAPSAAALAFVDKSMATMAPSQTAVRALFSGGTFCYEAQLAFIARGLSCRSNVPADGAAAFDGRWDGHVLLDLGDDDYTRGRPHPMIDPSLRDALVREQGADAQVAAILFDVVLGYGAHADPAGTLAQALAVAQRRASADGRALALIGHVCGTDGDPQDRAAQLRQLRDVGALVADSNIEAAELAAHLASRRTRGTS